MSDFNPSPYRGDANIGHVSEELFKMYFVGSNVSFFYPFCISEAAGRFCADIVPTCYCAALAAVSSGDRLASRKGLG